MNRIILVPLVVVLAAAVACGSSLTESPPTTTSARVRTPPPPSPAPAMGAMANSDLPLPQLPETTATLPNNDVVVDINAKPAAASAGGNPNAELEQSADPMDLNITDSLRKAIRADNTLSAGAKTVEVITNGRKVLLKGRVKTEKERMDIDTKARAADGVIDVDDRIELAP